jgi:hypothetical protein
LYFEIRRSSVSNTVSGTLRPRPTGYKSSILQCAHFNPKLRWLTFLGMLS